MGYRNGADDPFLYGRSVGGLLGTEGAAPGFSGLSAFAMQWAAGAQTLFTLKGAGVWATELTSTSGNGSEAAGDQLWLAGSGSMAADAAQATPACVILAWYLWGYTVPVTQLRIIARAPFSPFRPARRVSYFVGAEAGAPAAGTLAYRLVTDEMPSYDLVGGPLVIA